MMIFDKKLKYMLTKWLGGGCNYRKSIVIYGLTIWAFAKEMIRNEKK